MSAEVRDNEHTGQVVHVDFQQISRDRLTAEAAQRESQRCLQLGQVLRALEWHELALRLQHEARTRRDV